MAPSMDDARAAYGRQAWAEAHALLSAADDDQLAIDDLERLAVAAYLVGEDDESARSWERAHHAAQDAGNPELAARCAFWCGFGWLLRGELARANGWFARANRIVEGRSESAARGLLLVPVAFIALDDDPATTLRLSEEMHEIASSTGDHEVLAFALLLRGEALVELGDTRRGLAALDEVMVAVTTGEISPIATGIVYCAVIDSCMDAFDLSRAVEWTNALRQWCDAQPDLVPYRGQCLVHRSQVLQAHGEWPQAVSEAARACELLAQPPHPALAIARYQQAELHRLRGEVDRAEQAYRDANRLGREPVPGLALLRLAEGKVATAAATIRPALAEAHGPDRPVVLAAAVEILLAAREVGPARDAAAELTRLADDRGAALLLAMAAHATGAVLLAEGDAPAALSALRRAASSFRQLDMPYEAARACVLAAMARRAAGDHESAERDLDTARETFERLGADSDLARVAAVTASPAGALTERECEVLRLVAQGQTNREIGASLVISEHTVARHLQNVFTRLGLSSRAAATAYAYEHGIV